MVALSGIGTAECGAGAEDGGQLRTCAVGWGRVMNEHSFFVEDQKFIEPLRCENCGGNAHLTRRSPHAVKGSEIRVFECHECGHQIEQVVATEATSLARRCN